MGETKPLDDDAILRRYGLEPEALVIDLPWLIRSKRAAGRPKDLETIAELEALLAERERADAG